MPNRSVENSDQTKEISTQSITSQPPDPSTVNPDQSKIISENYQVTTSSRYLTRDRNPPNFLLTNYECNSSCVKKIEPFTFTEANQISEWKHAMNEELEALKLNNT